VQDLPAVINLILCFLYFFQNDVVRIPKKVYNGI
jgi:hypothetical protein